MAQQKKLLTRKRGLELNTAYSFPVWLKWQDLDSPHLPQSLDLSSSKINVSLSEATLQGRQSQGPFCLQYDQLERQVLPRQGIRMSELHVHQCQPLCLLHFNFFIDICREALLHSSRILVGLSFWGKLRRGLLGSTAAATTTNGLGDSLSFSSTICSRFPSPSATT